MRNRLIRLGLRIVALLLTLLLLEVVLRTTHIFGARRNWVQPDSRIGYRFSPGQRYWHDRENDHPVSGKINIHGWRDRDWSIERPAAEHRVAILGGSFVEAFQVESDSTFLTIVEKKMNDEFQEKYELMNFGRSDFTQAEELLVLKSDILKFKPDEVILFFLPSQNIREIYPKYAINKTRPFYYLKNDSSLALDLSYTTSREYKIKAKINPLKQKSALVSLLASRYNVLKGQQRQKQVSREVGQKIDPARNIKYRIGNFLNLASLNPDPEYQKAYLVNKMLIKKIAGVCHDNGIDFTLVLVACKQLIFANVKGYLQVAPGFDPFWFERDMQKFSDEEGIQFISLQSLFNNLSRAGEKKLFWSHWTYEGHKVVADVLIEHLRKK